MFSIYDGRTQFYQWDLDRKLVVNDPTIEKVHFCNRTGSCSLVRCVYEVNGKFFVDVPNIILQESYRVNVYGFDTNYTKHSASFNIVARTKPEDYVYTEQEVAQWEALEERIAQIEENGISDETIAAAIDNYLVENPIEAGATTEQAAQIEANKTAIETLEREAANHATTDYVDNAVKNVKPDLKGYATETYVDNAIANAQLGGGEGGEIDLSNYATKKYVDDAVAAVPTTDLTGYATQQWVKDQKYMPQGMVSDVVGRALENVYLKTEADNKFALKSEIPDVSQFQTAAQVQTAIENYVGVIENGSY